MTSSVLRHFGFGQPRRMMTSLWRQGIKRRPMGLRNQILANSLCANSKSLSANNCFLLLLLLLHCYETVLIIALLILYMYLFSWTFLSLSFSFSHSLSLFLFLSRLSLSLLPLSLSLVKLYGLFIHFLFTFVSLFLLFPY